MKHIYRLSLGFGAFLGLLMALPALSNQATGCGSDPRRKNRCDWPEFACTAGGSG